MAFFGLVWVASWVGCFFPSQHDLVKQPDYVTPNLPIAATLGHQPKLRLPLGRILSNLSAAVSQRVLADRSTSPPEAKSEQDQKASLSKAPTNWRLFGSTFLTKPVPSEQITPVSYTVSSPIVPSGRFAPASLFSTPVNVMQNLVWSWRLIARSSSDRPSSSGTNPALVTIAEVAQSKASSAKGNLGFTKARLCAPVEAASSPKGPARFQVRVRDRVVVEVSTRQQADQIAQQLRQILNSATDLSQLQPGFDRGVPAAKLGDRTLFTVGQEVGAAWNCHPEILTVDWVNVLRSTLDQAPFSLTEAQARMYSLQETEAEIQGVASWYGPYFHGRQTATGEIFDQDALTAAHPSLPFDTYLKVTNLKNGKAVIVRINDRGPYVDNRTLDLSREAARSLDSVHTGIVPISAVIMQPARQATPQRVAGL
ncbi:MAG TPA: septal ring lytic transglycosylase RlpA family protein [Thermosynechococcaceae cyanobacterium]